MRVDPADILLKPEKAARHAGLRYVSDFGNGIKRRRCGKTFIYFDPEGKRITDPEELKRIRRLAIPPAWQDIWICPTPNGHIQAVGIDARGRRQYRYHPDWRAVRDETKFSRLIAFSEQLPKIRAQVRKDLLLTGLPKNKVIAGIIHLLDMTAIRIGNTEYAKTNHSFGLTTMRRKHVEVRGNQVHFEFQGKSSKKHHVEVADRRIARIVRKCQELPGYELFQYVDEQGERHRVGSSDVNQYLQDLTGEYFTAKDFRTWTGSLTACKALSQVIEGYTSKQHLDASIKLVAERLGNTVAVCKKHYIHPALITAFNDGVFKNYDWESNEAASDCDECGLSFEEKLLVKILQSMEKTSR